MAAMKLKKSKWNLLLDWQKKNCFENCRKKLPDHCIWGWWIMESCSMVTKWKLLNLINTEQYVLIKNTYCVSRLELQFKMKPFWLLRVDFEETIEKYRSTMWQLSAKVTSWLPTRGSSSAPLELPILERTVPLHQSDSFDPFCSIMTKH